MSPAGAAPGAARDAGAQPERTRLAWRRTTLAYAVACALFARQVLAREDAGPAVSAAVLAAGLGAGLVLAWLARRRGHGLTAPRPAPLALPGAALAAGCTVTLAMVGMVMLV
ncbi:DUF202 domain-containing protein [Streptomyces sp. TRM 70351]|uniref:DUF202 domain-containing protein n=1 Tax=Streptomyces sp. TRM 70351 TaxID=3116552 RepID=UPI002E7BE4F1|nr:DUF202 domain-containing protein [Streptomyces sp. TRM 70351]MEE1929224.1 DUF202 domain-containing protein [Streptomyces sp. TRM 70351]